MTESVLDYMTRLGRAAREASRVIGRASTAQKNRALQAAANALDALARSWPQPMNRIWPPVAPTVWSLRCWNVWN